MQNVAVLAPRIFACLLLKFKVDVPINSIHELEEKDSGFSIVQDSVLHGVFLRAHGGTAKVGCEK